MVNKKRKGLLRDSVDELSQKVVIPNGPQYASIDFSLLVIEIACDNKNSSWGE